MKNEMLVDGLSFPYNIRPTTTPHYQAGTLGQARRPTGWTVEIKTHSGSFHWWHERRDLSEAQARNLAKTIDAAIQDSGPSAIDPNRWTLVFEL